MDTEQVRPFFETMPRIAELCAQNRWPDTDTLRVGVLDENGDRIECTVSFEEVLMEGAGCVAGRLACRGRYRLTLGAGGRVRRAERSA